MDELCALREPLSHITAGTGKGGSLRGGGRVPRGAELVRTWVSSLAGQTEPLFFQTPDC